MASDAPASAPLSLGSALGGLPGRLVAWLGKPRTATVQGQQTGAPGPLSDASGSAEESAGDSQPTRW